MESWDSETVWPKRNFWSWERVSHVLQVINVGYWKAVGEGVVSWILLVTCIIPWRRHMWISTVLMLLTPAYFVYKKVFVVKAQHKSPCLYFPCLLEIMFTPSEYELLTFHSKEDMKKRISKSFDPLLGIWFFTH